MDYRNVHIVITGRVQGVYFRAATAEVASKCKVTGWVRNTTEGSVEIVAEGGQEAIEQFIHWCGIGPETARVDSVDVTEGTRSGNFTNFIIRA